MKEPLISINLPTYNSIKTFEVVLKSIAEQTYKNYEIIVGDYCSSDGTPELALKYGCKVFNDPKKLLNTRYLQLKESKGELIVFICSDTVLDKTLLERIVKAYNEEDQDMWVLEEGVYGKKEDLTWVEKLTAEDKANTHKTMNFDPYTGVMLPRVFKKDLLTKAFTNIDPTFFDYVTVQDHAIIYLNCWLLSKKVGYITNALKHMEPKTLKEIFKHYKRWGKTAKESLVVLPDQYNMLFESRTKNRVVLKNFLSWRFIRTLPIILTRGLGYYYGKLF